MEKLFYILPVLLAPAFLSVLRARRGRPAAARRERRGFRHRHGSLLSIDYFAYSSKIRHWNAAFKVVFSLSVIILCIVLNNPYVSAAVIFAMAYIVVGLGELPLRDYLSVLTVPLAFILLSILAIAVDFSGVPVGEYRLPLGFGYLYTTRAMLRTGGFLLLKVLASVSALQLMILTTPSNEIISVMRKTRLPGAFIDLMHLIYRYIFILLDMFGRMKNAAQARLGYRGFKTSCRTFGGIAANMLVLSLKKSGAYYDAMEARCYDRELAFFEEEKKLRAKLILPAAAFLLYLLLLWSRTGWVANI